MPPPYYDPEGDDEGPAEILGPGTNQQISDARSEHYRVLDQWGNQVVGSCHPRRIGYLWVK